MCSGKTGISLITAAAAKIAFPGPAKGQKIKEGDAACYLATCGWQCVGLGGCGGVVGHHGYYSSNGEEELR